MSINVCGSRVLDQDLRSHLFNCHGEDLCVLRNLAGDLYELGHGQASLAGFIDRVAEGSAG